MRQYRVTKKGKDLLNSIMSPNCTLANPHKVEMGKALASLALECTESQPEMYFVYPTENTDVDGFHVKFLIINGYIEVVPVIIVARIMNQEADRFKKMLGEEGDIL